MEDREGWLREVLATGGEAREWGKGPTELSARVPRHFPFHPTLRKTPTAQGVRDPGDPYQAKRYGKDRETNPQRGRNPGDVEGWEAAKHGLRWVKDPRQEC